MFLQLQIICIICLTCLVTGVGIGYKTHTILTEADKVKTLEIEADRQAKIKSIDEFIPVKVIKDTAEVEIRYQTITKEIIKYVPKIQRIASECNITNGTVRLLNSNASNQMPSTTGTTYSTNTQPSPITEEELINYTNKVIALYNKAAVQANSLIEYNLEVNKLNP